MRAQFVRGGIKTRTDMLDRILGRKITIELHAPILAINDNGKIDRTEEGSRFVLNTLRKYKIDYKLIDLDSQNGPSLVATGTKDQLIPLIVHWDSEGRNLKELKVALKDWDGDIDELYNIIS